MGIAWGRGLHFFVQSVKQLARSFLIRFVELLELALQWLALKELPNLRLVPALCSSAELSNELVRFAVFFVSLLALLDEVRDELRTDTSLRLRLSFSSMVLSANEMHEMSLKRESLISSLLDATS